MATIRVQQKKKSLVILALGLFFAGCGPVEQALEPQPPAEKNSPWSEAETLVPLEHQGPQGEGHTCAANPWNVRVGAIRWDAWYGAPIYSGSHAQSVTTALSPPGFWSRAPFFAQVIDGELQPIDGDRPEIMDQEIAFAPGRASTTGPF